MAGKSHVDSRGERKFLSTISLTRGFLPSGPPFPRSSSVTNPPVSSVISIIRSTFGGTKLCGLMADI